MKPAAFLTATGTSKTLLPAGKAGLLTQVIGRIGWFSVERKPLLCRVRPAVPGHLRWEPTPILSPASSHYLVGCRPVLQHQLERLQTALLGR